MGFLSDIAALARAGYSPSEIKELMELEKGNKDQKPEEARANEEAAETGPKEDAQPEQKKDEQKAEPEEDPKLKELQDKITKLEADLAAAQKANVNKALDPAEEKSAQEYLNELAKSFM